MNSGLLGQNVHVCQTIIREQYHLTETAAIHRSQMPWNYNVKGIDMEIIAGESNGNRPQGLLDLQRHFQETVGTETRSDALDLYHGSTIHYYLCCSNPVAYD
jgi:hypothetical protein